MLIGLSLDFACLDQQAVHLVRNHIIPFMLVDGTVGTRLENRNVKSSINLERCLNCPWICLPRGCIGNSISEIHPSNHEYGGETIFLEILCQTTIDHRVRKLIGPFLVAAASVGVRPVHDTGELINHECWRGCLWISSELINPRRDNIGFLLPQFVIVPLCVGGCVHIGSVSFESFREPRCVQHSRSAKCTPAKCTPAQGVWLEGVGVGGYVMVCGGNNLNDNQHHHFCLSS